MAEASRPYYQRRIITDITGSILWAQPAIQNQYDKTHTRYSERPWSPEKMSQSRWGWAVTRMRELSDRPIDQPLEGIGEQLFVAASRLGYEIVRDLDPEAKLVLPDFIKITNEKLRQQVAVYYVNLDDAGQIAS